MVPGNLISRENPFRSEPMQRRVYRSELFMWWTHRAQRVWDTEAWGTSVDTTTMATVVHLATRALRSISTNHAFLPSYQHETQDTRGDIMMPTSNHPAAFHTFGELLPKHNIGSSGAYTAA